MQWLFRIISEAALPNQPFQALQWVGVGQTAHRILAPLAAWAQPKAPILIFQLMQALPGNFRLKVFPLLSAEEAKIQAKYPFCLGETGVQKIIQQHKDAIKKELISHCSAHCETVWVADGAEPGLAPFLPELLKLWSQTFGSEANPPLLFLNLPWENQPSSLQARFWLALDRLAQSKTISICPLGGGRPDNLLAWKLLEDPWCHPLSEALACYLAQRAFSPAVALWDSSRAQRVRLTPLPTLSPVGWWPTHVAPLPLPQEQGVWKSKSHLKLQHIQLLSKVSSEPKTPERGSEGEHAWLKAWSQAEYPGLQLQSKLLELEKPLKLRRSWLWAGGWPLESLSLSQARKASEPA